MEDIIPARRTVLLTGATGFVGAHTAGHLQERGFQVRCLVRATSDRSRLPSGVELAEGHLLNFESLQRAVKDCWGVMHLAGLIRSKLPREFYRVNSDGSANLARAAAQAQVERFVLCSSQAAAGPSTPSRRRKTTDDNHPITDYGKSKLAGELAVHNNVGDMWHSIVRPPAVYGPLDKAFLSFVKWVKLGLKVRIGGASMPFSLIHVADLARALVLALEADQCTGAVWFATDGADHYLEYVAEAVEDALGKPARWITIPRWVMPVIAELNEMAAGLRGKEAILGRRKYLELTQPAWTCDDSPFREATGYQETFDLRSGMQETVDWYLDQGWI